MSEHIQFAAAELVCDEPGCDDSVVGSAPVRSPYDANAVERAKREARRNAIDSATAEGWAVAPHGGNERDVCSACLQRLNGGRR
jgi:hypothetical protein